MGVGGEGDWLSVDGAAWAAVEVDYGEPALGLSESCGAEGW